MGPTSRTFEYRWAAAEQSGVSEGAIRQRRAAVPHSCAFPASFGRALGSAGRSKSLAAALSRSAGSRAPATVASASAKAQSSVARRRFTRRAYLMLQKKVLKAVEGDLAGENGSPFLDRRDAARGKAVACGSDGRQPTRLGSKRMRLDAYHHAGRSLDKGLVSPNRLAEERTSATRAR